MNSAVDATLLEPLVKLLQRPNKGIMDPTDKVPNLNNFSSFILIALALENRDRHPEPWDTAWWSCFCYYGKPQIVQQLPDYILAYVLLSIPLHSTFSVRNTNITWKIMRWTKNRSSNKFSIFQSNFYDHTEFCYYTKGINIDTIIK